MVKTLAGPHRRLLSRRGRTKRCNPGDVGLHLNQIAEADEPLTNDPLALLIGMVLDQPVPEPWSGDVRGRGSL